MEIQVCFSHSPRAHFPINLFMLGIRYVLMRATQKAIILTLPPRKYVCFCLLAYTEDGEDEAIWEGIAFLGEGCERTNKAIRSLLFGNK